MGFVLCFFCPPRSEIEHSLLKICMYAAAPRCTSAGEGRDTAQVIVHVLIEIRAEALGRFVGAVGWWAQRNGLGGTVETVAHGVDLRMVS